MLFAGSHNNFKPKILTWRYAGYFAAVLAALTILTAWSLPHAIDRDNVAAIAGQNIVSLTNQARLENGVAGLALNAELTTAAQAKADDMAMRGYFAHFTDDGMTPWKFMDNAGYDYLYAGENLAVHFSREQDVVTAWLGSPTHRANILNPVFKDIGVGISEGQYQGSRGYFIVQMFGAKQEQLGTIPFILDVKDLGASAASAREALSDPTILATIIAGAMVIFVALAVASTVYTKTTTVSGLIVALVIAIIAVGSTVLQSFITGRVII